jgi:hypothetical protein
MKPKWQRARIINGQGVPESLGVEVWVKCGPPVSKATNGINGGWCEPVPRYEVAILPRFGQNCLVAADDIELLARDEKDFAESVEFISQAEFLTQCQAASDRKRKENPNE